MEHVYDKSNMKLKGILTEKMLKVFNIPINKAKKHGVVKFIERNKDSSLKKGYCTCMEKFLNKKNKRWRAIS